MTDPSLTPPLPAVKLSLCYGALRLLPRNPGLVCTQALGFGNTSTQQQEISPCVPAWPCECKAFLPGKEPKDKVDEQVAPVRVRQYKYVHNSAYAMRESVEAKFSEV
jgi:hypothetical protein